MGKREYHMFEHIKLVTLRAVFSAEAAGTLPPYLGSTIRGILGHCFREFACVNSDVKCFCCEKRENCLYVRYFSNTGKEAGAVNPYTLHVLTRGKTEWKPGDECAFDLTLIGDVSAQAGIYLDALQAMERKGWGAARIPFKLERVTDPVSEKLIYGGGQLWLRNLVPFSLAPMEKMANFAAVEFDTPLRIVSGKQLCRSIPFPTLIQFLSRRISLLSQAFTDHRIEWDEEPMLEAAGQVRIISENWRSIDFTRYSMTKAENKLDLPAIEGWVLYEGNLENFIPLLEVGRDLHVGKGATIGFGHYMTSYDK